MRRLGLACSAVAFLLAGMPAAWAQANCQNTGSFDRWLADFKREALSQGISQATINAASPYLVFEQRILNIDRSQRFFAQTFLEISDKMLAGGRILLGAPNVTKAVWDTPLYRDALGLQYVRKWDRGFEFNVVGCKEIAADKKLALAMATKRDSITVFEPIAGAEGVEPFVLLPDGQWLGAKISRTDPESKKSFRAVVLGFYLADVANADDRRALLKEALKFLEVNPDSAEKPENPTISTASATATATDAVPATPAPATGSAQGGG
jgi:hypothetical protein